MQKVIAYYRVSTDKQGERGLGMQAQQHAVEHYLNVNSKMELIASYKEVESGKNNDRPEFAKAKQHSINESAVLLIAKLDRLARNVVFIGQLLEHESFKFIALDMPQAGRFEFHIRAALAEEEARLISARTKAGLARSSNALGAANPIIKAKASKGRTAKARLFRKDFIQMVKMMRDTTDKVSYTAVAKVLNKQGTKTRFGKEWSYITVKHLFECIDEDLKNGVD